MRLTSKKEEVIQRLQKRSEELLQEIAHLNEKIDSSKSEGRRQVEELRDRLTSKVLSRIITVRNNMCLSTGTIQYCSHSRSGTTAQ